MTGEEVDAWMTTDDKLTKADVTTIWWVRRDLRLRDNPALLAAQSEGRTVGILPWTSEIDRWSGRRRAYLARSVGALAKSTGGGIGVRRGSAAEVLAQAAKEVGARVVFASKETSPSGIRTQGEVGARLRDEGRELRLIDGPYLAPPGSVDKGDGSEFLVFTAFHRAWLSRGAPSPYPSADPEAFLATPSDNDLEVETGRDGASTSQVEDTSAGEERTLKRLDTFVETSLAGYETDRGRPDRDGTSRLSTALAFGEIHPRTILAATRAVQGEGSRAYERQLAWRDFHADVLLRHPEAMRESLTSVIPDAPWTPGDEGDELFRAWREGRTGYPLVDAGMRELASTGLMHNRVRMVAASFLVKDLHLPWQLGADHFRRTLVDYDHAQNQLNWQWVAGTGRDAAPFFRIFNPSVQERRFDPEGTYVARWIPEIGSDAYPEPIIDHAIERRAALETYRRSRRP